MVHVRSLPYSDLPRLVLLTLALPEPPRLLGATELPANWRDESDFRENHQLIASWLTRPDVLTLGVPSAVVPDSFNFLIHPGQASIEGMTVERTSAFSVDARL